MITSDEIIAYILTVPEGRLITPEHIYQHFGTQILPVEFYWKREVDGVAVPYCRVVNHLGWVLDDFGFYRVARRRKLQAEGFKIKKMKNGIWKVESPIWTD